MSSNGRALTSSKQASLVLISAPGFAYGCAPLNVGRLKAAIMREGFQVKALFLCVEFSDHLARLHPELVSVDREIGEFGYALHELYFSSLLFGHESPRRLIGDALRSRYLNQDIYCTQLGFEKVVRPEPSKHVLNAATRRVMRYCEAMHQFLLGRVESLDWEGTPVVGFSCVESQFLTSLFLARRLKLRYPGLRIVFGGPFFQPYNAEPILECFPDIDHMVVGEGEEALATLLGSLEADQEPERLLTRLAAPFTSEPIGRGSQQLVSWPPPDYDDIPSGARDRCSLTTYMGKGCSHWRCSFCAIGERGQQVRSAEAVFNEILHLVQRYGAQKVDFGDWEINGNPDELERLCDYLVGAGIRLNAWAEINARNTSPSLLRKMQRAGIDRVQIGIESFSPSVLRQIHKPATLLDNIKVLKWSFEARMKRVVFNLICNHPKSGPEDAKKTLRVLRSVAHILRPPVYLELNEIELYRTSDLFNRADHYGITDIDDYQYYRRCYPDAFLRTHIPMFNLSYRIDAVDPFWRQIDRFLAQLRRSPVTLRMHQTGDAVRVLDSRKRSSIVRNLKGVDSAVLRATADRVCTAAEICDLVGSELDQVQASLFRLQRADLVLEDHGSYLGLPVSATGTCLATPCSPSKGFNREPLSSSYQV